MRDLLRSIGRHAARTGAAALLLAATVQAAAAQSILRDAETEALLNEMAAPLVKAAGLHSTAGEVLHGLLLFVGFWYFLALFWLDALVDRWFAPRR